MVGVQAVVGAAAEQRAGSYLQRCGLELLERNYRVRGGEIDIVARDGPTLVFVEVRWRSGPGYGGAAASVDQAKRRRLLLAARHYLLCRQAAETPCRFDVIAFESGRLRWIRDAFTDLA